MRRARAWQVAATGLLMSACAALAGLPDVPDPPNHDGGVDGSAMDGPLTRSMDASVDASISDATRTDTGPSPDGSAAEAEAEGPCPVVANLLPCMYIPFYTGKQTVDGLGNDFCGYPAVYFDVSDGGTPESGPIESVNAYIQVAWSPLGLHAFIHLNEAPVVPAPSNSAVWESDALEIFATANHTITGSYGGGADEGLQVIVGPPSATQGAVSEVSTSVTGPLPALPSSEFASILVDGGYNVEVELPWTTIAGTDAAVAPEAGTSIALDFACDFHGNDGGAHHQTSFAVHVPTAPPKSCGQLFCDDRTWCSWDLSP